MARLKGVSPHRALIFNGFRSEKVNRKMNQIPRFEIGMFQEIKREIPSGVSWPLAREMRSLERGVRRRQRTTEGNRIRKELGRGKRTLREVSEQIESRSFSTVDAVRDSDPFVSIPGQSEPGMSKDSVRNPANSVGMTHEVLSHGAGMTVEFHEERCRFNPQEGTKLPAHARFQLFVILLCDIGTSRPAEERTK